MQNRVQNLDQLEFKSKSIVCHSPAVLGAIEHIRNRSNELNDIDGDTIGGVIRTGTFGYLATGPCIEVVNLRTGARVSNCNFDTVLMTPTNITCVTEVPLPSINTCILAIALQCDQSGGVVCLFAVQGARVLRIIDIVHKITSCCYVGCPAYCARSDLMLLDGCLAIGTDSGQVILLDLEANYLFNVLMDVIAVNPSRDCLITLAMGMRMEEETRVQYRRAKSDHINFAIQLEDLDSNTGPVLTILSLPTCLSLAIGFGDGRLCLFAMNGLEPFHVAHPPKSDSPLIKMAFIEPADDPRPCIYLWAFHTNTDSAIAVMHNLMYKTKLPAMNAYGLSDYLYDEFISSSARLTMPIFDHETLPVSCQAISKQLSDDEDSLTLCLLSWTKFNSNSSRVCVFDLNQWYKEQMPNICDWRQQNSYLAIFPLTCESLQDVWMDLSSLMPFNSNQRAEEHFWPSSINFECIALTATDSRHIHWEGLQNKSLDVLCQAGPNALLEPVEYVNFMIHASLVPEYFNYNLNAPQSIRSKQEFLLSIALEYNCVQLLRECARAWADGSHVGANRHQGLSLSTMTDWIWSRAGAIKETCNEMCVSLFDHSGAPMDMRTQNRLLHCTRQLKTLSDLLNMILKTCNRYIPREVLTTIESQRNSICMAHEYQEVLQWLLNMGLLPEGGSVSLSAGFNAVPYPYRELRQFYSAQRQKFADIDGTLLNSKRICRILYIDSFIERECQPACLRAEWRKGAGDGLYPPPSLQAMLRTLLVPGVNVEIKYTLFVYLFLDLSVVLNEKRFSEVVQRLIKFPAVFKMNPAVIKTTQAFWNLDHGHFETAVEELISPLSQERHLSQWQQEILVESLLIQEAPQLALRSLRAQGPPIVPLLQIRTLLANNLVAEAFQLQRSKCDENLLYEFFKTCHEQQKWHYVLELSLNHAEEECLGTFLRNANSSLTTNLHFLYLLQRSKYIEAISFIDNIQHNRTTAIAATRRRKPNLETPNTIVDAYKLTMTPATRTMSDVYYSLKDNINAKLNKPATNPFPLSTKLLQRKLDLVGGVYHRTVLSAEQTSPRYWFNQPKKQCNLSSNNIPFLRNPQYDMIGLVQKQHLHHNIGLSYATPYLGNKKRNMNDETAHEADKQDGPRKRRRIDPTADHMPIITSREPKTFAINTELETPIVQRAPSVRTPPKLFGQDRPSTPQSILKTKSIPGSPARSVRIRSVSPSSSDSEESMSNQYYIPSDVAEGFRCATPVATSTILESPKSTRKFRRNSTTLVGDDESLVGEDFPLEISNVNAEVGSKSNVNEESKNVEAIQEDKVVFDKEDQIQMDESIHIENDEPSSPPERSTNTLPYSLQESPLQRQQKLAEGIKARKTLHSNDETIELPSVSGVEQTVNDPPSIETPPMLLRRSKRSRSKTPDIVPISHEIIPSPVPVQQSKTPTKTGTPVTNKPSMAQRKPLSRLVLEANAIRVANAATLPTTTTPTTEVSADISSNSANTSIASTSADTDYIQSNFDDTFELSESFMNRWNAEHRAAQSSANSTMNETTIFGRDSMFSDSDASFADNKGEVVQRTPQPLPTAAAPEAAAETTAAATTTEESVVCIDDDSDSVESMDVDDEAQSNVEKEVPTAAATFVNSTSVVIGNEESSGSCYDDYDEDDLDENADEDTEASSKLVSDSDSDNRPDDSDSDSSFIVTKAVAVAQSQADEDEVINISSSDEEKAEVESTISPTPDVGVSGDDELKSTSSPSNLDHWTTEPDDYVLETLRPAAMVVSPNEPIIIKEEPQSSDVSWQELKTAECSLVASNAEDDVQILNVSEVDVVEAVVEVPVASETNTDSSYQDFDTAENSTTENMDNAQIMVDVETTTADDSTATKAAVDLDNAQLIDSRNISTQFADSFSRDLSQLNHAIIREAEEVSDETVVVNDVVLEQTQSVSVTEDAAGGLLDQGVCGISDTILDASEVSSNNHSEYSGSINEEVNLLDQGYLLEDTRNKQNTDEAIVMEIDDETVEMAPLVVAISEEDITDQHNTENTPSEQTTPTKSVTEKQQPITENTQSKSESTPPKSKDSPKHPKKREHSEDNQHNIADEQQQATPEKHIKLSSAAAAAATEHQINTTPSTSNISYRTRAKSISIEDNSTPAAAASIAESTPTRRSIRAKSVSRMNQTPSHDTPTTSRKTRGSSEPKHLAALLNSSKKTPIRRLLEESNAQSPIVEPNLTPRRRNIRRGSQNSLNEDDHSAPALGTPQRRSRKISQNISPIAEDFPTKTAAETPKRRTTRRGAATNNENDDTESVVSHESRSTVASQRSTRSRAKAAATAEVDDEVSVKSGKSTRSNASTTKKTAAATRGKTLPAIDEAKESENVEQQQPSNESAGLADTYTESRRLTRHQIRVMKRISQIPVDSSVMDGALKPSTSSDIAESDDDSVSKHSSQAESKTSGRSSRRAAAAVAATAAAKGNLAAAAADTSSELATSEHGGDDDTHSENTRPRRQTRKASASSASSAKQ